MSAGMEYSVSGLGGALWSAMGKWNRVMEIGAHGRGTVIVLVYH